jgi:hypothetical protein
MARWLTLPKRWLGDSRYDRIARRVGVQTISRVAFGRDNSSALFLPKDHMRLTDGI